MQRHMSMLDRSAAVGDVLRSLPALPCLSGARVRLRPPRAADVAAVYALFSDPLTMRWWSRPPMRQRDEAEAYIASIGRGLAARSFLNWLIADAFDDQAIGSCTLYDIQVPHLRAGIGYALSSTRCGQGLASEAVGLALRWGFGQLGLNRIEADAHPDNLPSRRLLERLGFQLEGQLRQRFVAGEEIQDSAIYGLLAEDWRARR
jgi:[ribosomal protein S5]-alanine N-acetyltransferase